jgi:photosystem II stability/assembly factor-like uncharacterized protein
MKKFIIIFYVLNIVILTETNATNWLRLSGFNYINMSIKNHNDLYFLPYYNTSESHIFHIFNDLKQIEIKNDSIEYYELYNQYFIDNNTGYKIKKNGSLYGTLDAGITWDSLFSFKNIFKTSPNFIRFYDKTFGYTLAKINNNNMFLKSTNGGKNWDTCTFNGFNINDYYKFFSFFNKSDGIIIDISTNIYLTSDTGKTWVKRGNPSKVVFDILFLSKDIGFIASKNEIYNTSDGGKTWQKSYSSSNYFYQIFFLNDKIGWIAGRKGQIIQTKDGGNSWKESSLKNFDDDIYGIYFSNENNGWVYGTNATILQTSDGGITWNKIRQGIGFDLKKIHFFDNENGIVCGDSNKIFLTSDKGYTWDLISLNRKKSVLNSMYFYNKYLGWIGTSDGSVLNTTNGGKNWIELSNCNNSLIKDLIFVDQNTGYLISDNLYLTFDGGLSWGKNEKLLDMIPDNIFFLDKQNFYLTSHKVNLLDSSIVSILMKTTDSGNNWKEVIALNSFKNNYKYFGKIQFLDNLYGFVQNGSELFKTTNGGLTWDKYLITTFNKINGFKFLDKKRGWAYGDSTNIYYTIDSGKTWKINYKPNYWYNINDISKVNDSLIYICGNYGLIEVFSDNFLDLRKVLNIEYNDIKSMNIFPIPARDYIEIKNVISNEMRNPVIEIFNIFGEKISTPSALQAATPQEGNFKIDVSNLAAGVYFIRVGDKFEKFVKI